MLSQLYSAAVNGLKATIVQIEINVSRGVKFILVGLPDNAVKESFERIKAALTNTHYRVPVNQTVINMAPANIHKEGSGYDLPMAIGILACNEMVNREKLHQYVLLGELGLDGSLRSIKGALPIAIRARKEKYKGLIVPRENVREAAVVNKKGIIVERDIKEEDIISTLKEYLK